MIPTCTPSLSAELDRRGEAFAAALARDPDADLGSFLPPRDHLFYLATLAELIRIDLGRPRPGGRRRLADYTSRFPALLECPAVLEAAAHEEYARRRRAGEDVNPAEYRVAFGIETGTWPTQGSLPDAHDPACRTPLPLTAVVAAPPRTEDSRPPSAAEESNTDPLGSWAAAARALPEVGTEFLGFRLVEVLGRGAFGCVYLAHQGMLAGRPVALKIACDIVGESRTLAQLQHTNIVPIYSFHRAGPFQAVCMPFFGRTTLAQVISHLSGRASLPCSGRELKSTLNRHPSETLASTDSSRSPAPNPDPRQPGPIPAAVTEIGGWGHMEGLSYVEVVLWLGAQLADG